MKDTQSPFNLEGIDCKVYTDDRTSLFTKRCR